MAFSWLNEQYNQMGRELFTQTKYNNGHWQTLDRYRYFRQHWEVNLTPDEIEEKYGVKVPENTFFTVVKGSIVPDGKEKEAQPKIIDYLFICDGYGIQRVYRTSLRENKQVEIKWNREDDVYAIDFSSIDKEVEQENIPSFQEQLEKAEYYGTIGEVNEIELVVEKVIPVETRRGKSNMHLARSDFFHKFVWFDKDVKLHPGDKYLVRAEIYKHNTYQGQKQTVLKDCKVVKSIYSIANLNKEFLDPEDAIPF